MLKGKNSSEYNEQEQNSKEFNNKYFMSAKNQFAQLMRKKPYLFDLCFFF